MRCRALFHREQGFNLIENLVTLFVLTVGLLGVAGMQAVALKTQQTSHFYDRALSLAQSMADRMRANVEGAKTGYYDMKAGTFSNYEAQEECTTSAGCDARQMTINDIYEWQEAVARTLPEGDSYICLDGTPSQESDDYLGDPYVEIPRNCDSNGDIYTIHVVWDMDPLKDGNIVLTADPQQTDGHLVLVFEP